MYIARPHLRLSTYSEYFGAQYAQWRYKQIALTDNTDYSAASYNDSSWAVGQAPMAGLGSSYPDRTQNNAANTYDARFAILFATPWDVGTRMWIRRRLRLKSIPAGGFNCVSFIEDHCKLYVNGVLCLTTPSDVPGGAGRSDTLSADKFHIGTNVIAVQCDDESSGPYTGSLTYADFLFEPIP